MSSKNIVKFLIFLLIPVFIIACKEEVAPEEPVPEPEITVPAPEPEEAPEPEVPEEEAPEPAIIDSDKYIIDRMDAEQGRVIETLMCDATTNTLKFTLTNPTDKIFTLKKLPALEADARGLAVFTPTINGRVVRKITDMCGSDTLEPGQTVNCQGSFVPNTQGELLIRIGPYLDKKLINYLRIKTTQGNHEVTFECV